MQSTIRRLAFVRGGAHHNFLVDRENAVKEEQQQ
jgi:hypothetical protein